MAEKGAKVTKPPRGRKKAQVVTPLAVIGVGVCTASLRALGAETRFEMTMRRLIGPSSRAGKAGPRN